MGLIFFKAPLVNSLPREELQKKESRYKKHLSQGVFFAFMYWPTSQVEIFT